jgi:hypothetical protein
MILYVHPSLHTCIHIHICSYVCTYVIVSYIHTYTQPLIHAYAFRSNFMTGYNIVFDPDGKRLGFAKSECNYEEFNQDESGKCMYGGAMIYVCVCMLV